MIIALQTPKFVLQESYRNITIILKKEKTIAKS